MVSPVPAGPTHGARTLNGVSMVKAFFSSLPCCETHEKLEQEQKTGSTFSSAVATAVRYSSALISARSFFRRLQKWHWFSRLVLSCLLSTFPFLLLVCLLYSIIAPPSLYRNAPLVLLFSAVFLAHPDFRKGCVSNVKKVQRGYMTKKIQNVHAPFAPCPPPPPIMPHAYPLPPSPPDPAPAPESGMNSTTTSPSRPRERTSPSRSRASRSICSATTS